MWCAACVWLLFCSWMPARAGGTSMQICRTVSRYNFVVVSCVAVCSLQCTPRVRDYCSGSRALARSLFWSVYPQSGEIIHILCVRSGRSVGGRGGILFTWRASDCESDKHGRDATVSFMCAMLLTFGGQTCARGHVKNTTLEAMTCPSGAHHELEWWRRWEEGVAEQNKSAYIICFMGTHTHHAWGTSLNLRLAHTARHRQTSWREYNTTINHWPRERTEVNDCVVVRAYLCPKSVRVCLCILFNFHILLPSTQPTFWRLVNSNHHQVCALAVTVSQNLPRDFIGNGLIAWSRHFGFGPTLDALWNVMCSSTSCAHPSRTYISLLSADARREGKCWIIKNTTT